MHMSRFVLVPGAWHGPWSYETLIQALEDQGHEAVAPPLPGEDPEAGCARYAEDVRAAIPAGWTDVTCVAHSLGGLTAPLVAEGDAVTGLVLLCAMVPFPGVSL